MDLLQWAKGLKEYFKKQPCPVRLFDADGYVFWEVYNQQKDATASNLSIDECYRDFLLAIINEVFTNANFRNDFLHGDNISVKDIASWACLNDRCRWQLLPLCVFFSTLWAYQFKDDDNKKKEFEESEDFQSEGGNDSNYRQERLTDALKWALDKTNITPPQFDTGTDLFSGGIVNLFNALQKVFPKWMDDKKLFMPRKGLKYRKSPADGITISHAIFRFGEIARIKSNFWRQMDVGQTYSTEDFKRIASLSRLDGDWMNSRDIKEEELLSAIEKLYKSWDGSDYGASKAGNLNWYLYLAAETAKYIVGFDRLPQENNERWFKVSQERKSIGSHSLSWAEPISWKGNTEITYDGREWHSLRNGEESCLFNSSENKLGIFVRYRSNGQKSQWWTRFDSEQTPELRSNQTEFLVCARDEDAIKGIEIKDDLDKIKFEDGCVNFSQLVTQILVKGRKFHIGSLG